MDNVTTEIAFRVAKPEESAMLAQLTEQTFRESWTEEGNEADVDQYVSESFAASVMSKELANPAISYLLALNSNNAVAYCKLERNLQPDNHELEKTISISRVYVSKAFHNKQIGSELLKRSIELAQQEKFKTIWLGVWNENHSAIRLYERFGFVRFGTYQFIMGTAVSNDYLMMRLV